MNTVVEIVKSMTNNELIQIVKDWDSYEANCSIGDSILRQKVTILGAAAFHIIASDLTRSCMRELLTRMEIL